MNKMKIFVDTNVFILGFLAPEPCNSKIILELFEMKKFDIIVSELVINEARNYFKEKYGERTAHRAINYIKQIAKVILKEEIEKEMESYKGKIADKDLENLAVAKHEKVDFIISFDKHYENFVEYKTPKKFLEILRIKAFDMEY